MNISKLPAIPQPIRCESLKPVLVVIDRAESGQPMWKLDRSLQPSSVLVDLDPGRWRLAGENDVGLAGPHAN